VAEKLHFAAGGKLGVGPFPMPVVYTGDLFYVVFYDEQRQ
jgi:hypothetical protein